ncbi:hypothetical protein ACLOJK_014502 [Asimina triloba]
MQSRGSGIRLSRLAFRSRISNLMLSMFATMASIYVAGRLWQDAENRVYLIKELDRRTGQGQSAISVDDTLKVIACREQHKKLSALEMELAAARHEGFVSKYSPEVNGTHSRGKPLAVIGIITQFGRRNNRNAIRKSWLPIVCTTTSGASKQFYLESPIAVYADYLIDENHVEAAEELPKKTKLFFAHAADTWDAEFYVKVNDDVYVNIGSSTDVADLLKHVLRGQALLLQNELYHVFAQQVTHLLCHCSTNGSLTEFFSYMNMVFMYEDLVFRKHKWYEPDWWKFGDGKSYFRHASGEVYVISRALAQFISINRSILRTYAHDDVSVGSWFIGLDVKHVDEGKLCCSSWSSGAMCAALAFAMTIIYQASGALWEATMFHQVGEKCSRD